MLSKGNYLLDENLTNSCLRLDRDLAGFHAFSLIKICNRKAKTTCLD